MIDHQSQILGNWLPFMLMQKINLDPQKAEQLLPKVTKQLQLLFCSSEYKKTSTSLGKIYFSALLLVPLLVNFGKGMMESKSLMVEKSNKRAVIFKKL